MGFLHKNSEIVKSITDSSDSRYINVLYISKKPSYLTAFSGKGKKKMKIKITRIVEHAIAAVVIFCSGCSSSPEKISNIEVNEEIKKTSSESVEFSGSEEIQNLDLSYPVVDTGQSTCYDEMNAIDCPQSGEAFSGQDAQYSGSTPQYRDNGDGTISDLVTELMWQKSADLNNDGEINASDKLTYKEALSKSESLSLAGYDDWRLPSIKEMYSLILFTGTDPSGWTGIDTSKLAPFIDEIFDFGYGDTTSGERIIDAQFASGTKYVSTTMNGAETMFGVNFADGRIKGYGLDHPGGEKKFYVLYVRGNTTYGIDSFRDNGNGTVTDIATGLTWMQADSGRGMVWAEALAYCENLDYSGRNDWRLPNIKELQSIVDYNRSPDTSGTASIDPVFEITEIVDEIKEPDYPYFWSSTTHANLRNGGNSAYISFGRAMGKMNGIWMDVHGAGAQRSDPKNGDPDTWPDGHGPQGDAIRIENFARCVSGGIGQDID